MIKTIIDELNMENGSNYKMEVLKRNSHNKLLQRVLKMTYCKVSFNYGVTLKNVNIPTEHIGDLSLSAALDVLESEFVTRETTGNDAVKRVEFILRSLSAEDSYIFEKILNRDLRINMGRSNINKVFKNLIIKPVYMRCDIGRNDSVNENGKKVKGTYQNINFKRGAFIQKKADGTYREFTVTNGNVDCVTRSGERHVYPRFNDYISQWPDRIFNGEITVWLTENLLERILPKLIKSDKKNGTDDAESLQKRFKENPEGFILPRSIGNGLINSDDVPHDNLVLDLWDCITHEDYARAGIKDKKNPCIVPYELRLAELNTIVNDTSSAMINVIESYEVFTLPDALRITSQWMTDGFEGGVLKDRDMVFENRTSKYQLKLKLKIDAEVRCVGFTEGRPGTKRVGTFGAMIFENDEGTIRGQCSGFTDEQLKDFNSRRDELIGEVFTVQFNDVTKGRANEYYALSHPNFVCFRDDKDSTDTLERVQQLKEMAMQLKGEAEANEESVA